MTATIEYFCPEDGGKMNYQITTDEWQCPKCQGTVVTQHHTEHVGKLTPDMKDGGTPQLEVPWQPEKTPDTPTK